MTVLELINELRKLIMANSVNEDLSIYSKSFEKLTDLKIRAIERPDFDDREKFSKEW